MKFEDFELGKTYKLVESYLWYIIHKESNLLRFIELVGGNNSYRFNSVAMSRRGNYENITNKESVKEIKYNINSIRHEIICGIFRI